MLAMRDKPAHKEHKIDLLPISKGILARVIKLVKGWDRPNYIQKFLEFLECGFGGVSERDDLKKQRLLDATRLRRDKQRTRKCRHQSSPVFRFELQLRRHYVCSILRRPTACGSAERGASTASGVCRLQPRGGQPFLDGKASIYTKPEKAFTYFIS
jgi:hypothetical protein